MIIELTQGFVAEVDPEDYLYSTKYVWCIRRSKYKLYAGRNSKKSENKDNTRSHLFMHRFILIKRGIDIEEYEVDHEDNNGLNNRFNNLRVATKSQNGHNKPKYKNNTSGCKGVCWDAAKNKWWARISVDKNKISLGYFNDFDLACKARKAAEIQYHGDFRWKG